MKAVAVTSGGKDSARLIDVESLKPKEDEVLVKVLQVGIDGTDIEINSGLYGQVPIGLDYLIVGHESLGVVEEPAGDFKKGDLVVATVRRPCPQNCLNCRKGEVDMCLTGDYTERGIKGRHGFMSEYYVEEPAHLIKIPGELKDVGVLLEPLSVVEKGLYQAYKIQERLIWEPQTALVLGAGPIGLLATMLLRLRGLNVYTLDIIDKQTKKAGIVEELGAQYVDSREKPLQELAGELDNIDIIFEATGNSSVALKAMSIIGKNGIMCLTGVTGGNKTLEICADCLNMQLVLGNKVVFGTVNANRRDFKSGVQHMQEFENRRPGLLEKMITRRVKFDEYQKAFERERDDIKVVIEF